MSPQYTELGELVRPPQDGMARVGEEAIEDDGGENEQAVLDEVLEGI